MTVALLAPFGFTAGGSDVTPTAVNWGNIAITDPYTGIEANAAQTIAAIDTAIDVKVSLSSGGKVRWLKNGVAATAFATGSSTVSASVGDQLYVQISAVPTPPTSGDYVTGTATVTNESDGAAVLDTFTYEVQFIFG